MTAVATLLALVLALIAAPVAMLAGYSIYFSVSSYREVNSEALL